MLQIVETFTSIQGESTQAGRPCFFIRLAGCNLRCVYCDTMYANNTEGKSCSPEELLDLARQSGVKLVEITGGEPLMQSQTADLCDLLLDNGFEVMMETNGSLPIDRISPRVRRILDCKLPDSGMSSRNDFGNYQHLTPMDEVKFVVSSRQDFDYAVNVCREYHLNEKTPNLLVSPVWGKVDFAVLADWVRDCGMDLRMQVQLHKVIWGNKPGV